MLAQRSLLTRFLAALIVMAFALTVAPSMATAQDAEEDNRAPKDIVPVILVVDVPAILARAKAAQDIKRQLEERRAEYQEQIAEREEELRNAQQELEKQRTILSNEAFQTRAEEFRTQLAEVQRGVQQRKAVLETAFGKSMNELRKAVVAVVAEVAKEEEANLVLSNQQIVLVDTALDVTEKVLTLLDEKVPSATINMPDIPEE
ncbi:MAG: OmpH family outer membrane protein [Alphaproteobacteria bacterium]|nr:OmpH family outer membrane protein [Alphaproteobacteria bacterium SS10]